MLISALKTGAIVGIVIAVVVVVLIIILISWIIGTYNRLIRAKNDVEEGFSTIDVYLKKRWDLIPNLVETVKGYAKHESSTLEAVIQARNTAAGAATPEDKFKAENVLTGALKTLFAVSEAYPDLKADRQFLNLQNQLQALETEIAQARKYYNAKVKAFNNKIMVFPSNLIARAMKCEKQPFFEVSEEQQRENVKVSF